MFFPGNSLLSCDRRIKFRLTDTCVVTQELEQVTVLIWEEGMYEEMRFAGDEVIESQRFPELELTVNQVLAAGAL